MGVGKRIKQRRLELGLTQTELAKRLGLKSKVSISTVENEKEDISLDRLIKFADALDVTPGHLMGWDDESEDENHLVLSSMIPSEKLAEQIVKERPLSKSSELIKWSESDLREEIATEIAIRMCDDEVFRVLIESAAKLTKKDAMSALDYILYLSKKGKT